MSFEAFAQACGLVLDRAVPDGRIHRVDTVDKKGRKNGAYKWTGEFGWVMDWRSMTDPAIYKSDKPLDPLAAARIKRMTNEALAERLLVQQEASRRAKEVVQRCIYGPHPYFVKKGLHDEKGLVDTDGRLVVPMRNSRTGDLQSVQWIDGDGSKKFLFGGRAADAVHAIGPRFGPHWYAEGFGTSLSLRAALKSLYRQDTVVTTFSAGNLERVARGRLGFVAADNDESGRGEEAAKRTGLPYILPPRAGDDWNDVHDREGLQPLIAAVLKALETNRS